MEQHPFIDYVNEDKSKYTKANSVINPRTGECYVDPDGDFLIGESGGFLMNIDFTFTDTYLFSEVASKFTNTGKFTTYPKDSIQYKTFWANEKRKRRSGLELPCGVNRDGSIRNIRITGRHYGFLNYSRINRTPNDYEVAEQKSRGILDPDDIVDFPRFWDGHYWVFKCKEFAERNGFNRITIKARRKGFSYIEADDTAETMNLIPNSTVVLAAYDIKYLTDGDATAVMVKNDLEFLEQHTPWKRFFLSQDVTELELGFKKKKEGHTTFGYKSKCVSVSTAMNSSAAIGKKAKKIKFEEGGKFPNLEETIDVTLSNTESGSNIVGTIDIWGTAGTKDANWTPFSNLFYGVSNVNRLMPFENIWDTNSRNNICGCCFPNIWAMEDSKFITMDRDGNSNLEAAYEKDYKDKQEALATMSLERANAFIGQRANSPSEAFNKGKDNLFSSPELDLWITQVRNNPDLKNYRDGRLIDTENGVQFRSNAWLRENNITTSDYITSRNNTGLKSTIGCIRIYQPPYIPDNNTIDNLYAMVVDPIGKDVDSKELSIKHSFTCIKVFMLPTLLHPSGGDILVACYVGRHNSMEEDNKIAYNLARYYNIQKLVLPEVNRGQVVQDFRKWKALNHLMCEPKLVWDTKIIQENENKYGINITTLLKENGLKYLKDWLYRVRHIDGNGNKVLTLHYIYDIGLLLEFQNYDSTHNFDRISAILLYMYIIKYLEMKPKQQSTSDATGTSIYDQIYN